MRRDKVVLPYAKLASTHPRRCIFFGTINPEASGYLTDATGNRRYWPVSVTVIDIEGIVRRRDQLWAEAVQRYRAGDRWWLEPDEETAAIAAQTEREEEDAWVEPLDLKIKAEFLSELTTDKALSLLNLPHERKDRRAQMRAAAALKSLGYTKTRVRDPSENMKPKWIWRKEQ
jgi:predicted P-loop ATPase